MRIVGPQTLTVGSSNTIDDPAQLGGNPSQAVQIQNSSPYQLNVTAAGDVLSIQPFFAQTVQISGQPLQVTPIASTGTGTCIVTFVFLLGTAANTGVQLPDGTWVESPPQEDGPLTAAAIAAALSTQGIVDFLASFTATSGTGASFVAKHSYQALLVLTTTGGGQPLCVSAVNQTQDSFSFGAPFQEQAANGLPPANFDFEAILPMANQPNDTLEIIPYYVLATAPTVFVYGLTAGPIPPMRSDGRVYPVGSLFASVQTTSGTGATLVPAPTSPLRVMVMTAQVGSSGGPFVFVTTPGAQVLAQSVGAASPLVPLVIPPQGLLLPIAQGLALSAVAATVQGAQCTYDIVP